MYEWRTKLLTTRNGHGKSGWSPIGCEGFSHKFDCPKSTPYDYFSLPQQFVGYSSVIRDHAEMSRSSFSWGCGEPEATKPSTVHAGHIVYVYVSGVCM